jgi:hypothetical protein
MPHGERKHKTSRRKTAKLSRVAQAAIAHNDEIGEAYVAAVRAGRPTHMIAGVARANPHSANPGKVEFGDGTFSVQLQDGRFVRALLRGMTTLPAGIAHVAGVSTAVHAETPVVMEDMGLRVGGATHLIVAVLSRAQANAARPVVARSSSHASPAASNSSNFFNRRSSGTRRRNAAARAAVVEGLARTRTAAQRAEYLRVTGAAGAAAENI